MTKTKSKKSPPAKPEGQISASSRLAAAAGLVAFLVLSGLGLTVYFATDDCTFLERALDWDLKTALDPFLPDRLLFRPLTQDLYFRAMSAAFDMHPVPYHLFNLLLMAANIGLAVYLGKKIVGRLDSALWAGFFYAIAVLNFRVYTWISCIQDIAMIFLTLLAVVAFLKTREPIPSPRWPYRLGGPLLFALSLLAKESGLWLPIWLWIYDLGQSRWSAKEERPAFRSRLFLHLPFDLVLLLYLVFRVFLMSVPREGAYGIEWSWPVILKNLEEYFWYLAMSFPIPALNPLHEHDGYALLGGIALVIFLVLLFRRKVPAGMIWSLAWFTLGLAPFLLLREKAHEYYISLASLGFFWMLGRLADWFLSRFRRQWALALAIVLIALTAFNSGMTHRYLYRIHWVINVARDTEGLHQGLLKTHPNFPPNAKIVMVTGQQMSRNPSLFGIRALYHRKDLRVFTEEEAFEVVGKGNSIRFLPRPDIDYSNTYCFVYTPKNGFAEVEVGKDGLMFKAATSP